MYICILTEKNTAANASDAFHHRHVVGLEIFIALTGPVATVHFVQETAGIFVAVVEIDVLQQPVA